MELIGKQIAIETILGQPPELHYPSWYAAQIEKLPPAPPEYLAEQAGILVTDADTISRQAAIEAVMECYDNDELFEVYEDKLRELPSAQPERIKGRWIPSDTMCGIKCSNCGYPVDDFCYSIDYIDLDYKPNYCHNCGSDNREVTT